MTQHTSPPCPLTSTKADIDAVQRESGVTGGCPVSPLGYDAPPAPLGPDSLTWRYFGDWRGMLQGPWAGSMQNMHPQLGAAVEEHSTFFRERWPRLMRSLYPIGGVVFDGDRAPVTGAEVRDYHTTIKGVDEQGRRYHALNPDVFYWAHATFFVGTIHVAERFCGGLTEAQKRQLFDEHIEWYRMYGMSMRPVPASWEEFQDYWDHMCRNVLENNFAARAVLDLTELPKPPFAQWVPDWLWAAQRKLLAPFFVWLTVGLYDPPVRELMGYRGRAATNGCTGASATSCVWSSLSFHAGTGSTRGRAPAGTAPPGASRPTPRWCTRRRAICRRSTSATTRCTTAPRSDGRRAPWRSSR